MFDVYNLLSSSILIQSKDMVKLFATIFFYNRPYSKLVCNVLYIAYLGHLTLFKRHD